MPSLDTPPAGDAGSADWSILYRARGEEVNLSRPTFTGDIVRVNGQLFVILQHPCALRTNGVDLVDRLLVARVNPASAPFPKDWHNNFKKSPLPDLEGGVDFEASFLDLDLLPSDAVESAPKVASLSQTGVNILLQRWVFHNSRAVVPLSNYQDVSSAEYEEADLTEDWVDARTAAGLSVKEATAEAHEWLRAKSPSGPSWQDLLADPASRSHVRVEMRKALHRH